MSIVVGSAISKSGMVENVGLASGIASPSFSVQKLFPLLVSWMTLRVPDAGRCRVLSAMPFLSRTWSKMLGLPLESLR